MSTVPVSVNKSKTATGFARGNAINVPDNATGTLQPRTFDKLDNPVLHAADKPEFAGGLIEEGTLTRKYVRASNSKTPGLSLAWRRDADSEFWLNLWAAFSPDPSQMTVKEHSIRWADCWTACDYEPHFYGDGIELRLVLKSVNAPTVFKWSIKKDPDSILTIDNSGHPRLSAPGGESIMYIGHPVSMIEGGDQEIFWGRVVLPQIVWSIEDDDPYDFLVLTMSGAAVAELFSHNATQIKVRL